MFSPNRELVSSRLTSPFAAAGSGRRFFEFGLAGDMEIDAPHAPTLNIHKLGIGGAGKAGVLLARHDLVILRQGVEVELHHMAPRRDPLEVEHPLLVGIDECPVFQENPYPFHPFQLSGSGAPQAPAITCPMRMLRVLRKSDLTWTLAVARLEEMPLPLFALA